MFGTKSLCYTVPRTLWTFNDYQTATEHFSNAREMRRANGHRASFDSILVWPCTRTTYLLLKTDNGPVTNSSHGVNERQHWVIMEITLNLSGLKYPHLENEFNMPLPTHFLESWMLWKNVINYLRNPTNTYSTSIESWRIPGIANTGKQNCLCSGPWKARNHMNEALITDCGKSSDRKALGKRRMVVSILGGVRSKLRSEGWVGGHEA